MRRSIVLSALVVLGCVAQSRAAVLFQGLLVLTFYAWRRKR